MTFLMYVLLFLTAYQNSGVYAETIRLSPEYVHVEENTSVTLTCSKENGQLDASVWKNSQFDETAFIYYQENCIWTKFLQSNNLFAGMCNGDGTYSVLIKRADRTRFGAVWQCGKTVLELSNEVTINELVYVATVEIYPPDETYMKENRTQTIRCRPSACQPEPTIRWYLHNPTDLTEYNITEYSRQSNSDNEDGLIASESLLYLLPNRSINGWTLNCKAWNYNQRLAVLSKGVVLNVSYPPDSPPKILGYGSGNLYRIIEADKGELSCSVTGGNPLANLSWSCFNSESTTVKVVNNSVINNVTWTAVRGQNVCSCESYHIYNGKKAAYVNADVLYPPIKPFFRINSTSGFGVLNLIQNNTQYVSCESRSNPMPIYIWNGPKFSNKKEQTLGIKVMDIHDEGQYRCTAENRMIRSDNTYRDGSNTSAINVKMLYPPRKFTFRYVNKNGDVISDNNINVVKGDSFSIYCDADGYPRPVFKWDNNTNGHSLNIIDITSDTKKTCTATNWMNETVGEGRLGSNSATVSISVLYKASVLQFYIGEESTVKNSFTVNETELVTFSCNIESKPLPNATVSHKGEILHVSVSNNSLVYTKTKIQCKDSGMYICSARNKYNYGTSAAKNLTVYVNCSPRPSPFFEFIEKVKIPKYTSATLRFSALAFPEPGPSGFTWYYFNGSERILLADSHNIAISSSSSQSSLTIINVTLSDYGQYFLMIANSIGDYEHIFSLEPRSTTVSNYVANSSSAVVFVAVGVGTSVATLLIGGSVLFAYRYIRRRRKRLHSVHNDNRRHRGTSEDNNEFEVAEYEQISMKSAEARPSISDNRESVLVNESAQQYEKLDANRTERDQYSQLPALSEQVVIPREQKEAGPVVNSETQHNIQDYVNIRI